MSRKSSERTSEERMNKDRLAVVGIRQDVARPVGHDQDGRDLLALRIACHLTHQCRTGSADLGLDRDITVKQEIQAAEIVNSHFSLDIELRSRESAGNSILQLRLTGVIETEPGKEFLQDAEFDGRAHFALLGTYLHIRQRGLGRFSWLGVNKQGNLSCPH